MHFAFNIQEILDIVLNILYEDAIGYKSLVSLSLTCKILQKPALDLLWYTLPSWTPLIRCLPSDAWEVVKVKGESVLELRRETTPDDWLRCKFYAPRVRRLGYPIHPQLHSDRCKIDVWVYKELSTHGVLPFENLHAYRCGGGEFLSLRYPLGSGLKELEVVHYPHKRKSKSKAEIFSALASFYPSLRTLKLSGEVPLSTSPISEAITGFNDLEVLFCPRVRLADDVLTQLATRNNIRSLHTANTVEDLLRTLPKDSITFPNIYHLGTESHTISTLSDLLSIIGAKSLRSVNFGLVLEDGLPEDPQTFFRALKKHCSASLKSIYFQDTCGPTLASITSLVTIESFEYILGFPNIEEVQVCSDWALEFCIDDAAIQTLARAWPNMRVLDLDGGDVAWRKCVTLDGLLHVAALWPGLESFNVALQPVTNLQQMPSLAGTHPAQLQNLGVGNAVRQLTHPVALTVFLKTVFPHLSSVYDFDWREDWMKISELLRQYGKGQLAYEGDPIQRLQSSEVELASA